jgi:hypothetical protein
MNYLIPSYFPYNHPGNHNPWCTLLKRSLLTWPATLMLFLSVLLSCTNENMTFTIGDKYIDPESSLHFVDSITINSYTIKIDSLRTSGYGTVLIGQYHDNVFGSVHSRSFFTVGLPLNKTLASREAVYDSLHLIMIYNNYSVGDTTAVFTMKAHRLTQKLKPRDDGSLYNTSSIPFDIAEFGSISFVPRPHGTDTVKMKLDDNFGNELFLLLDNKDEKVATSESFLNYFKGLIIDYDTTDIAVLGFKVGESTLLMRLYYHYFDFQVIKKNMDFPVAFSNIQFNQISSLNPSFIPPETQTEKLPASESDNHTFIQAGTGISTKVEFPYLRNLRQLYDHVKILKADLVFEPVKNSYNEIPLPEETSLFISDRLNRFGNGFLDVRGNYETGDLTIDKVFQEETTYVFKITSFIENAIHDQSDDVPSLILTITPDQLYKSLDRLVLNSQLTRNHNLKLRIFYMNY